MALLGGSSKLNLSRKNKEGAREDKKGCRANKEGARKDRNGSRDNQDGASG